MVIRRGLRTSRLPDRTRPCKGTLAGTLNLPGAMTELFSDIERDSGAGLVGVTARRAIVALFALVAAVALLGMIGQSTSDSVASTPSVRMRLSAPEVVRGGLFFQSRLEIRALTPIEHPRLVLDNGWIEGMQVNSIEPAAESEASRDGKVVLSYGALEAGDVLRVWFQFEVDPTSVGERSYAIELDDEDRPLVRIPRTIRVLP